MVNAPPRRRRISFVLPPSGGCEHLALPAEGLPRHGDPRPLLYRRSDGKRVHSGSSSRPGSGTSDAPRGPISNIEPQHCLAVSSLALDLSTIVVSSDDAPARPRGILYSGGRDGLVCAWDLALPTRPRSRIRRSRARSRHLRAARQARYGLSDDEDDDDDEDAHSTEDDSEDEAANMAVNAEIARRTADPDGSQHAAPLPARPPRKTPDTRLPYEDRWVIDAALSENVTPRATLRQAAQPHTNWINAMLLCNLNRTVITASSDCTIRAWSPHDPDQCMRPTVVGEHSDFVRTLTHARSAGWIASAGFDRRVRLWDVREGRCAPLLDLADGVSKGSIYSLACDIAGRCIAVGSPDRTVRVWDPRQDGGRRVAKLIGHGDNIRSLLVSDDARTILSASADASIRLWDLRSQRCLNTFTHHSDSVWSLYSNDPDLDVFYSADRAGYVCKVDLSGCGDVADGECVTLLRDQNGEEGPPGINAIVAADDTFIWTATGSSSIRRWRDVPARSSRATPAPSRSHVTPLASAVSASDGPPLAPVTSNDSLTGMPRRAVAFAAQDGPSLARTISGGSATKLSAMSTSHRPSSLKIPHSRQYTGSPQLCSSGTPLSPDTNDGLPLASLVPLGVSDGYLRPSQHLAYTSRPDVDALYSASVISSPFRHASFGATLTESMPNGTHEVQHVSDARARYEDRLAASEAVPMRQEAEETIAGRRGLVQVQILNDRRHAVASDSAGSLSVWDLLLGCCVGSFARQDLPPRLATKDAIELVASRIEGEGTVSAWSSVDTRVGRLTVHLDAARVFDGEAYCDENGFTLQSDNQRFNMGRMVLRNLFARFVAEEVRLLREGKAPPSLARIGVTASGGSFSVSPSRLQRASAPSHISLASVNEKGRHGGIEAPLETGMSIALATPALTPALPPPAQAASLASAAITLARLSPIPQSPRGRADVGTPAASFARDTSASTVGSSVRSTSRTRGNSAAATPTLANPSSVGSDYFSQRSPSSQRAPTTPSAAEPTAPPPASLPTPASPASGGGLMGRLRGFARASKRASAPDVAPAVEAVDAGKADARRNSADSNGLPPAAQAHLDRIRAIYSLPISPPDASEVPLLDLPPATEIVISEEGTAATLYNPLFRGLVCTAAEDAANIEYYAPDWLLTALLNNRVRMRDPVKVAFTVTPWLGSAARAGIEEMAAGNARLTASRVLRIAKVQAFVAEHAGNGVSAAAAAAPPPPATTASSVVNPPSRIASHISLASADSATSMDGAEAQAQRRMNAVTPDEVEILCGDVVVPSRVTLAGAMRYYHRNKGGDLPFFYRRKAPRDPHRHVSNGAVGFAI